MSSSKVDAVLRVLDRIKTMCDESINELGMSHRPILQFFGPPVLPQLALFNAAYDRTKLQKLLENVPEPPEETTSRARHIGATSEASRARIEAELAGVDPDAKPAVVKSPMVPPAGPPHDLVHRERAAPKAKAKQSTKVPAKKQAGKAR